MAVSKVKFGEGMEITDATAYQLYLLIDGKAEAAEGYCDTLEDCESEIALATLLTNGINNAIFGEEYADFKPTGFIMEINFHQVVDKNGYILEEKIYSKIAKKIGE